MPEKINKLFTKQLRSKLYSKVFLFFRSIFYIIHHSITHMYTNLLMYDVSLYFKAILDFLSFFSFNEPIWWKCCAQLTVTICSPGSDCQVSSQPPVGAASEVHITGATHSPTAIILPHFCSWTVCEASQLAFSLRLCY